MTIPNSIRYLVTSAALAATLLATPLVTSTSAIAANCSGSACNDVSIIFTNGCYVIRNYATRRVRVALGPYFKVLERDEVWTLMIMGKCVTAYVGPTTATYAS